MHSSNSAYKDLVHTTWQSMLSLAFSFGSILAGLIVANSLGLLSYEPWVLALYPGILSMRGVVGGLFTGRLSTALHLGTIDVKVSGSRTKNLRLLLSSIVALTFESSILLATIASLFSWALWGINTLGGISIFFVVIATMGLSVLVISPLTIAVALVSVNRGLDPDITTYPIVSTLADILVTLCYILVLSMYFTLGRVGNLGVLTICFAFSFIVLIVLFQTFRKSEFIRTIKESAYTVIIVAVIVNITGAVLSQIRVLVGWRPEIYVVYPALINMMGAVGAIIGSTVTTKLALGILDSSLTSIIRHRIQIVGSWLAAIILSLLLTFISFLYRSSEGIVFALKLLGLYIGAILFAGLFMILISFSIAILTFHRGLDPDNFVIPLESSLADAITTVSLLALLLLAGLT